MTLIRRIYRALVRARPYKLLVRVVEASNDTGRQQLLAPRAGRRIRFVRAKVIQESSDGRRLWELFFGDAGNIITAPNRAIDILAVPDMGHASSRIFSRQQGPRGKRDEVLSGRWRGFAPTKPHKIIIEYTEES